MLKSLSPLRLLGLFVLLLIGFGALQSLASAQDSPPAGESFWGVLSARGEKNERTPVSDVRIQIFQEGNLIGEDISDETGTWSVPVPEPGTYTARLDISTLPDGLDLTNAIKGELSVSVRDDQAKRIIFGLGEGANSGISRTEFLSNLFLAGLRIGAIIATAGIGLSLIYGVTNLVNFAHGELITMGALLAYFFSTSAGGPGWHLLIAVIPSLLLVSVVVGGIEIGLWNPLRKRGVTDVTMMVISIGLSLAFRYLYLIIFKGQARAFADYSIQKPISFLSFTTSPKNLWVLGIAIILLLSLTWFLLATKQGTSIRALADNPELAKASGINVDQTILIAWLVGGLTTALSGVLLGVSQGVDWEMGWQFLLIVFAGVIFGGTQNIYGAIVGGFTVGIFIEMSTYWVDNTLKVGIALGIISFTLLFMPRGITGWRTRVG